MVFMAGGDDTPQTIVDRYLQRHGLDESVQVELSG
jgi:hypothetical protein